MIRKRTDKKFKIMINKKNIKIYLKETFVDLKQKAIENLNIEFSGKSKFVINNVIVEDEKISILDFLEKEFKEEDEEPLIINIKENHKNKESKKIKIQKGEILKDIEIDFRKQREIIKDIDFNALIIEGIIKICKQLNLNLQSFVENTTLYVLNSGEFIEKNNFKSETWIDLEIDQDEDNVIEIKEKNPISFNKILIVNIIYNGAKYKYEKCCNNTKISDIMEYIHVIAKLTLDQQILILFDDENFTTLDSEKIIEDYIDKEKIENNLEIHLKEKKMIKLSFLKKDFEFKSWAREPVSVLKPFVSMFLKEKKNFYVGEQIWYTENGIIIGNEDKLEDYEFRKIIIRIKLCIDIYYERQVFRLKDIDSNIKILQIKNLLRKEHNLAIPTENQLLTLEEVKLSDNQLLEEYFTVKFFEIFKFTIFLISFFFHFFFKL